MNNQNSIKAIIFDMDGTLINSNLDFSRIRKDIGIPKEIAILDFVDSLDHQAATKAHQIIKKHENEAAKSAHFIPGAQNLLSTLAMNEIPHGIFTNNSKTATSKILSRLDIKVELVLTREDVPAKPDPSGLLHFSSHWDIDPCNIAYLGDFKFDILAAKAAKMHAWLIQMSEKTFDHDADEVFSHLDQITDFFVNK